MTEERPIYKITPYCIEKRGNLKMVGNDSIVEFQQLKNMMVIHVKENMTPDAMASLGFQLKSVFGEDALLIAFKEDVSFFIAEQMSIEEIKTFKDIFREDIANYLDEQIKKINMTGDIKDDGCN